MDLSKLSTADLEALQAGNLSAVSTEGLQSLSGPQYGTGKSFDVTEQGLAPTGSPQAQAAYSPVAGNSFLQNAQLGVGKFYTDALLGARQLNAQLTGGDPNQVTALGMTAADKASIDAPLQATGGGKVGQMIGAAPLAFTPGANTYAGAALVGGGLGALQPVAGNQGTRLLNTAVGVGAGVAGKYVGDRLASWLPQRAAQPLMGHTPSSADAVLARAVGSDAANLGGGELGAQAQRLGQVFQAGRNAATSVDLSSTSGTMDDLLAGLNPSVRSLVEGNENVSNLLSHATGPGSANGNLLGHISTGLRQDAYTALNSEGGNRELGLALQQVRNHVEDLIESNIADPALQSAYRAARPQYGLLQDVRYNPSVLNASTGRANMEALGKYLQRNNPAYTAPGAGENDLFNAAMWGQAGGGAKGVPSFSLGTPWKLPLYALTHNPLSRAVGGVVSRAGAPVAPAISYGLPGGAMAGTPLALTYLEQ